LPAGSSPDSPETAVDPFGAGEMRPAAEGLGHQLGFGGAGESGRRGHDPHLQGEIMRRDDRLQQNLFKGAVFR